MTWRARGARGVRGGAWAAGLVLSMALFGCAHVGAPQQPAASPGPESAAAATAASAAGATAALPASSASPAAVASASGAQQVAAAASASAAALAASVPAVPPRPVVRVPRSRLDPQADSATVDLWERIRRGLSMPTLDDELVRKWEQYYASRPDYMQRMASRGARYLFYIVEELDRRELPMDLALLPFVESAFDPQAQSAARAAGMWQFMPGTGRDFELRQNVFRDDRRDVLASTRAALDYLQMLHRQFDDWHLALAAYNWGQGNVQKAVARNQRTRAGTDYVSLRMPDETRNYVPKLQAIKNIVQRPGDFGLDLPPLGNHPYFISVPIDRDIDVAVAARLSGLDLEQFHQLNPQFDKPVIVAAGTPQVLLPYDNANRFLRQLAQHKGPLATWTAWVAPRTLKPADAARHVGMSENELRDVNRIPARMLVKAGSTLLVARPADKMQDVGEHVADHGSIAFAPEGRPPRKVSVTVGRRGDSLAAIARRYGLSVEHVAATNGLSPRASLKPGQVLTLLVPQRQASGTQARRASAKATSSRSTHSSARSKPRARVAKR